MNATSLSVADLGKTTTLAQSGAAGGQASDDGGESGGFLSVLGEVIAGDKVSADAAAAGAAATDTEAARAGEAGTSAVTVTDGAEQPEADVKLSAEQQAEAELMAALSDESPELSRQQGAADQAASMKKAGSESVANAAVVADELQLSQADSSESQAYSNASPAYSNASPADSSASQAMQEGSKLLGRLDEASQTLQPAGTSLSGKALPPVDAVNGGASTERAASGKAADGHLQIQPVTQESLSQTSIDNPQHGIKQDVLSKYVVVDGERAASDALVTGARSTAVLSGAQLEGEQGDGQALAAAGQTVTDGELSGESAPLSKEALITAPGQAIAATVADEAMVTQGGAMIAGPDMASDNQSSPDTASQLVWGTVQTASAAGVSSALGQQVAKLPEPDSAVIAWQNGEVLTPQQLTQLSEETGLTESELLAAAPVNLVTDPLIKSAEQVKTHTAAPAQAVSQQQLQQIQQAQHQQAMQTAQSAERVQAQQMSGQSSPELAAMVAQHANHNTMPQAVKSGAAAHGMLSSKALAAAGLGGTVANSAKRDQGETDLAQQLTSAAGQQGLQTTQARAESGQVTVQTPLQMVRDSAGDQLAERVQMMLSKNLRNVDIRLDPPELGRMQIRMSMNGDMASVQFTVNNPQARDMIEHAMPRLRDMLAQQGLQLADSSVHQQNSGQQRGYAAGDSNGHSGGGDGRAMDESGNLDESINLDVNIATKDDGISYYA